ncbi:sugar-binding transcriptional regulator [Quadrisphaera sp. DSM 44207]|uniref:sugar-binding transcriptional regulator n=1 Tax=Quadrisphaera sp. DSM 44207 TaxID=1881057 RepID=UPI00088F659F|nr:sugar-binding domain-containing protein [Quadrisphaera sp. DSM 44207]SDQ83483.1 DNA-binding transcriptional regulator LsrR, DeoR family [Quadrisphaera sp. DSM 44207]
MSEAPASRPSQELLRAMTVAARLYHVDGVRQRDIAERLATSQARVSRLLRQAEDHGIVRTVVAVPEGLHPDLEERLEQLHGLSEVHVVEVPGGDGAVATALGPAAARLLADVPLERAVVGFTPWSSTLRAMAASLDGVRRTGAAHVVEMLGDLGPPLLQHEAARATQRLAEALGAEPVFLRTPGVVATPALRRARLRDPHVRRALDLLDRLDVAFVGIGPVDFHSGLAGEGFFSADQLAAARERGAVGQLDLRLVDARGRAVPTPLDDLVVGATLEQLRGARRRVAVAGGASKHEPLAAALAGGWVDVLVTDAASARHLLAGPRRDGPPPRAPAARAGHPLTATSRRPPADHLTTREGAHR